MIAAVVPAAGLSSRMGRPKLALPLGERTIIERVVLALRDGGVKPIVVVIAPHVAELGPIAAAAGASVVVLPSATADMRATVEHGLRWLDEHDQPTADDAWMLAPADYPLLDGNVVRGLCDQFAHDPTKSIVVPIYNGKRGHPVLIGWKHVAGIRATPAGQGIDAYLRAHSAETLELSVTSAGVLNDLDTPGEYERLRGLTPW
jgi:CTP:molybdopterin cytidylyltransferase MocA